MLRQLFEKCLVVASPGFNGELQRRNGRRARGNSPGWFIPEEAAVAAALAKLIVPPDEDSPGIDDICPPGQTAVTILDKMVAEHPDKQRDYSRGLLAFDYWALSRRRRGFADLAAEDQASLLCAAQARHDRRPVRSSSVAKLWRAFDILIHARKGIFHAERFYPVIRNDCLQIFYTSSASWAWLRYDGPPMDTGYSSLVRPR